MDMLLLSPGELSAQVVIVSRDSYDELRRLVGGDLEGLALGHDMFAYINENGKEEGLPYNEAGDLFVKEALARIGRGLLPSDYIVGPVVVCGFADEAGYDQPAPGVAYGLCQELRIPVVNG